MDEGYKEGEQIVSGTPVIQSGGEEALNVRRMSYEDLQKSLAGDNGAETVQEAKPAEEPEVKPEEGAEVKPKEKTAGNPPVEEPPNVPEPVNRDEYDKLLKRVEAQEKFIARQGTTMGLLKKTSPQEELARIKEIQSEYDRLYYEEGPFAANQYYKKAEREHQQKLDEAQQEEHTQKIETNKQVITGFIPDYEQRIADVAAVMEEDGAEPDKVRYFQANPHALDPAVSFNLVKRAELRKENSTLKQELDAAKAKIAELEKKPEELLTKINQATKAIDGKGNGTAPPSNKVEITTTDVRRLSYAELKEREKQLSTQT